MGGCLFPYLDYIKRGMQQGDEMLPGRKRGGIERCIQPAKKKIYCMSYYSEILEQPDSLKPLLSLQRKNFEKIVKANQLHVIKIAFLV